MHALTFTFFAVLALHVATADATMIATYPVRLSARDRELIVKVACLGIGAPGVEKLKAVTYQQGSRKVEVTVQCAAHRREESLPVAHYTTCENGKGVWRCEEGYDAAQMLLPDRSTLAVVPRGVNFHTAIELISETLKLTVPPFHDSPMRFLGGTCHVAERAAVYSAEFQRFSIDCSNGEIAVTKVCPGGRCSYFSEGGGQKWQ